MWQQFRSLAVLAMLAALAGCGGPVYLVPGLDPDADRVVFTGSGHDPDWTLTVTGATLSYAEGDAAPVVAPRTDSAMRDSGWQYEGGMLQVGIAPQICDDPATGTRYASSVTIQTGGVTRHGCGGLAIMPLRLMGTRWRFVSIDGTPIPPGRETRVRFDRGYITTDAGCYQFRVRYGVDDDRLLTMAPGPAIKTCGRVIEGVEDLTMMDSLFAGEVEAHYRDDRLLELTGNGHAIVLAQVF